MFAEWQLLIMNTPFANQDIRLHITPFAADQHCIHGRPVQDVLMWMPGLIVPSLAMLRRELPFAVRAD